MKIILSLIVLTFMVWGVNAQTVFWSEDFTNTGCNQGATAVSYTTGPNGAWAVTSTGTNDTYANSWFISATSAFTGVNNCGDRCITNSSLTDGTLHVSNVAIAAAGVAADSGAVYFNGGGCGFGICAITNRRAESPAINCTGLSGISISFAYMENGDGVLDDGSVWYYDGLTWTLLSNTPKTATTCSLQGIWEAFTITLPSSADNNPNVKLGFNWTNNDDGVGTDPSFAIDSIRVMHSPVTMITESNEATVKVFSNNQGIVIDTDQPYQVIGVRDLLGRSIQYTKENNTLNLNTQPGIYIVHLKVNGNNVFRQVVAGNR